MSHEHGKCDICKKTCETVAEYGCCAVEHDDAGVPVGLHGVCHRCAKKIGAHDGSGVPGEIDLEIASEHLGEQIFRKNIQSLFQTIGADRGACKSCGATIHWVLTKNGKRAPFTAEALNHFADCPNAQQHRKGKK